MRGAALRLAELIEDTRLDEYLWQDFKAAKLKAVFLSARTKGLQGKDLEYNACIDLFKPRGLSEILRGIADEAEPLALNERPGGRLTPLLARPQAYHAQRQHFIETLTQFMRDHFDGPFRRVVAITASAAFDQEIDKRQVIRIAP